VSDDQPNPGDGPRPRGLSPLSILVVAFSTAALALTVWLRGGSDGVPVWRAVGDLPAQTILTARDVKLAADGSTGDQLAEDVIGHLTLRPLGQGAVVKRTDVGPDIPGELGRDAVVVGVDAAAADAVAGDLEPGDRVLLVAAPRHVEGILMSIRLVDDRYHVAVALRRPDAARHDWFRHGRSVRLVRQL
jgi:hypothetical protein